MFTRGLLTVLETPCFLTEQVQRGKQLSDCSCAAAQNFPHLTWPGWEEEECSFLLPVRSRVPFAARVPQQGCSSLGLAFWNVSIPFKRSLEKGGGQAFDGEL